MSLTNSFKAHFRSLYIGLILVLAAANNLHAAAIQSGLSPNSEKAEAFRAHGSYAFLAMMGLIVFLLVFRGREIRRQHPRLSL